MEPVFEFYGYDDETVAEIYDNSLKAEWAYIGEGYWGDFTGKPDDCKLLRFYIYRYTDGQWEEIEDASYCTNIPLNTDKEILEESLRVVFERYREALVDDPYASVKKLGEELSWISPDEFV